MNVIKNNLEDQYERQIREAEAKKLDSYETRKEFVADGRFVCDSYEKPRTVTLSLKGSERALGELWALTIDLNDGDGKDSNAHRDTLARTARWRKTCIRITAMPIETAQWLAGELRYFGEDTGWDEAFAFRYKPFNRMADKLQQAISEATKAEAEELIEERLMDIGGAARGLLNIMNADIAGSKPVEKWFGCEDDEELGEMVRRSAAAEGYDVMNPKELLNTLSIMLHGLIKK